MEVGFGGRSCSKRGNLEGEGNWSGKGSWSGEALKRIPLAVMINKRDERNVKKEYSLMRKDG